MTSTRLLINTFDQFFDSEKSSAFLLVIATIISVAITNSFIGQYYLAIWQSVFLGLTLEHWVNDGFMAIFFLLIGLELEREFYVGELSIIRNALLPTFAALGGTLAPALIHYLFNAGLTTQAGIGIPMATDIAFAIGALALLGTRIPPALKVFVVAFAVIDDLIAIIMIALFYSENIALHYLISSIAVFVGLLCLNIIFRVDSLLIYLLGGLLMWIFMLKSGVHATAAGVMLAFAIPFWSRNDQEPSLSHQLENYLHKPVAFLVLPLFALANTGIVFDSNSAMKLTEPNSLGVILGLLIGKPLGVALASAVAVTAGLCTLPSNVRWGHLVGAGLLGGIGFTISIFITNLAFIGHAELINSSKIAIFIASLVAGNIGLLWLNFFCERSANIN